jgi:hypothetical protein
MTYCMRFDASSRKSPARGLGSLAEKVLSG